MKSALILAVLITLLPTVRGTGQDQLPRKGQKVLFLGNSITYAGDYIVFTQAVLKAMHPGRVPEFINCGLPSETVSGLSEPNHAGGKFARPDLHERLGRVLDRIKPDLVFACYGMNDGIYQPFDMYRFQKFREGMQWLHDEVTARKIKIVHLTPPLFDEKSDSAYASVVDRYAEWIIGQQRSQNWQVVDIHFPMKHYLQEKRASDPGFVLAADGIHPGREGHWLIARELLFYLGCTNMRGVTSVGEALKPYPDGQRILNQCTEQQMIMKDAWLTETGHTRPGMTKGLPLKEAFRKAKKLEKR